MATLYSNAHTHTIYSAELELFWKRENFFWDLIKMQKPEKICIRHRFFRPPSRRLEQVLFWQIVQACVKVPSKCHFWGAFSKSCRFCGKKLQYKFVKFCMAEVASFILQVVTTKSCVTNCFVNSVPLLSVPLNTITLENTGVKNQKIHPNLKTLGVWCHQS